MLLPIRSRVLHFIATEKTADIDTVMAGLRDDYGRERQFTHANFLDHLLSLKENGLIDEDSFTLDEQGQLQIVYGINQEGIDTINKYLPKKWRFN
ncbi:hypothetical protein [uncultured Vagococcus sp.]|uniref:hypothetical protein n=1 Tax=uncultured Vagococcus sp. TaxID=189676 RepID=UPI0028D5888D|nr:hypothetical protein [uncultured Vagococcus sp.]